MSDINPDTYISQLEAAKGGKIGYRCFSLYYVDNQGNFKEHGVFMYQIGKTLFYEDFMFKRSFLGIELNKKANEEYIKFENSININDIKSVKHVSKKKAVNYCSNPAVEIPKAGILCRLFGKTLVMVEAENGFSMFLDLPINDFKDNIKKIQKEK